LRPRKFIPARVGRVVLVLAAEPVAEEGEDAAVGELPVEVFFDDLKTFEKVDFMPTSMCSEGWTSL